MKEIINKCDKILNNHNSNFVTKSISLLHIIKSHPEYNKNYILTSENGSNAIFFYVKILYKFFKRNFDFIITYAKRLAHESGSKKISILL